MAYKYRCALLILGLLGLQTHAFAVNQTHCKPFDLSLPCKKDAWDVGFETLYLRPALHTLNKHANLLPYDASNLNLPKSTHLLSNQYTSSKIPLSKKDALSLTWYHLEQTQPQYRQLATAPQKLSPTNSFTIWQGIQAEFAHTFLNTKNQQLSLNAGVEMIDGTEQNNNYGTSINTSLLNVSGTGPRVGLHYAQNIGHGVSVYTQSASSLLFQHASHLLMNTQGSQRSLNNTISTFEEKLGIQLQHPYATGDLTVFAGYLWFNYLTPLTKTNNLQEASRVNLGGPYAGLTWQGND